MSTNATIAVQREDGSVHAIYLHWDGYAEHVVPILTEHYNSWKLAEELIELGDLSVLAPSMECPEGHTWATTFAGHCIAYHRDRGESLSIDNYATLAEFEESIYQHTYLFIDNKWKIC